MWILERNWKLCKWSGTRPKWQTPFDSNVCTCENNAIISDRTIETRSTTSTKRFQQSYPTSSKKVWFTFSLFEEQMLSKMASMGLMLLFLILYSGKFQLVQREFIQFSYSVTEFSVSDMQILFASFSIDAEHMHALI